MLIDKGTMGQGASGGLLGALLPYMPDRWDMKKQLQLDALVSLESEIRALEASTGLKAGYRRSGRIIPLAKPHLRVIADGHEQDALKAWQKDGRQFHWHVLDTSPSASWPEMDAAGYVHDTLAARVSPRDLVAVLLASIRQMPNVTLAENCGLVSIDPDKSSAVLDSGANISFGTVILANGWESFDFLSTVGKVPAKPIGQPVKGQSALLKAEINPNLPVLFQDGLYIVPHDNGTVAIGSTSENRFDAPFATDGLLDELIEQARGLVPALREAPVIERWAGLRPKASLRDPIVGPHPDFATVIALTGGFKITFGLAHVLAQMAVGTVFGEEPTGLPESFTWAQHLKKLM
jgi:glycine oxidase